MPRPSNLTPKKSLVIIKAYGKGESTSTLAKKHKVSQRVIQRLLKANKKTTKSSAQVARKRKAPSKTKREAKAEEILSGLLSTSKAGRPPGPGLMVTSEELLRQHDEGISVVDLATQHGTTTNAIRRQIDKAHKTPPTRKKLHAVLHNVTTVMGDQLMDADMILTGLRKARQTPKSKDAHSYLVKLLCTNKDVFEPVPKAQGGGRGVYRARNAQPTAAPTTSNGRTSQLRVEAVAGKTRKFKAMKQIFVLCRRQGVAPPDDVAAYFGGRAPGDGELVNLTDDLSPRELEDRVVYINLSKIPRKTKRLRIEF